MGLGGRRPQDGAGGKLSRDAGPSQASTDTTPPPQQLWSWTASVPQHCPHCGEGGSHWMRPALAGWGRAHEFGQRDFLQPKACPRERLRGDLSTANPPTPAERSVPTTMSSELLPLSIPGPPHTIRLLNFPLNSPMIPHRYLLDTPLSPREHPASAGHPLLFLLLCTPPRSPGGPPTPATASHSICAAGKVSVLGPCPSSPSVLPPERYCPHPGHR